MKIEKGITIVALSINVIMFTAIIVLLANLTNYVYPNLININSDSISSEEFVKFNTKFVSDIKESSNALVTTTTDPTGYKIILSNGIRYTYVEAEKAIYRDDKKIAINISSFSAEKTTENNKDIVKIRIGTGKDKNNVDFGKTIKYVLKYW